MGASREIDGQTLASAFTCLLAVASRVASLLAVSQLLAVLRACSQSPADIATCRVKRGVWPILQCVQLVTSGACGQHQIRAVCFFEAAQSVCERTLHRSVLSVVRAYSTL